MHIFKKMGLLFCLGFSLFTAVDVFAEDFSVVVIPDMHVDDLKNNPIKQLQWVYNNQSSENILLLTAIGDYLTRGNSSTSWKTVKDTWKPLFDLRGGPNDPFTKMAASFSIGNHDYDSYRSVPVGAPKGWNKTNSSTYRGFFGKSNWINYSWYGNEDLNDENHVQFIKADGYTLMHLSLEWDIGNAAGEAITGISNTEATRRLQWVGKILSKYPHYPTMITTHEYLSVDGKLLPAGKKIWDVIKKYPNVFLVMSGHVCQVSNVPGTGSAYAITQRTGMGPVLQLLSDYQNFQTSRAWTRQIKFTGPSNHKTVTWSTFSVSSLPRVELTDSAGHNFWVMDFSRYGAPSA